MDVLITITDEDLIALERALSTTAGIGALGAASILNELLSRTYRARGRFDSPHHDGSCLTPEHGCSASSAGVDFSLGH